MPQKDFVYTFEQGDIWFSPGTFDAGESAARLYFWENYQDKILRALRAEMDQGWRPFTEVGPSAFKLRSYTKTESRVTVLDVIIWLLTLTLVFWVQLLAGSLWVNRIVYEPTEFRVGMTK